jgi:ligand-binding sensor domain-containing protein
VRDDRTGDLYAATDFGVVRRDATTGHWHAAGRDLPMVEVPSLAIDSEARVLYAATHGRRGNRSRSRGAPG